MGMKVELVRATVFSSYLRHMDQLVVLGEATVNDDGTRGYREEVNKVCEEVNKVCEEDSEHAILVPHIYLREVASLSSPSLQVASACHGSLQARCLDHALTAAVTCL